MEYLFILILCVVHFRSADLRSFNSTHVDIPNETEIVYATSVSGSANKTITNSAIFNLTTYSKLNQTLFDERNSKSLVRGQQSKLYLDLPVNIPNQVGQHNNVNIDHFNPFRENTVSSFNNSTPYVLASKPISNKFYHKINTGYTNYYGNPYRKTNPTASLELPSSIEVTKDTGPPPVRYNTKYPSLGYIPDTAEFDTGQPYPQITYGYPYVMDKQMQILHTFKSLSESLLTMIYEVYYCIRYYWHEGMMKCMTGRTSLFGDRMLHADDLHVTGDVKVESRVLNEPLDPEKARVEPKEIGSSLEDHENIGDLNAESSEPSEPLDPEDARVESRELGFTPEDQEDTEDLKAESRVFSETIAPEGNRAESRELGSTQEDHEDPLNATADMRSVGEARKKKKDGYGGGGGAVGAFSSGLGTGIGTGVTHQVFQYQEPPKKKKKKGGSHHHHSHGGHKHHAMKHLLPYAVAAKAKLLSILAIVGFLAKKAWIVSSISLLLSLLGLFAKLTTGGGSHRSTEVILAKPSIKDWNWDKDWDRLEEGGTEERVKPPTFRLVPVEEPTQTPIPLHYFEKDTDSKEFYM